MGSIKRLMCLMSVDLPLPDSPITQRISLFRIEKEASATAKTQSNSSSTLCLVIMRSRPAARASFALSPKIFQTFLHSIAFISRFRRAAQRPKFIGGTQTVFQLTSDPIASETTCVAAHGSRDYSQTGGHVEHQSCGVGMSQWIPLGEAPPLAGR